MNVYESKIKEIIKKIKTNSTNSLLELIELYKKASVEERDIIRKNIDSEISHQLITYSHDASIESVRKRSKEMLFNGLVAQSIEDAKFDYRDNVANLFLLYHSAKRIKEDPNLLVRGIVKLSSKDFGRLLYDFLGRDDLDTDLVRLSGYKVVEKPEFDYVWVEGKYD